MSHSRLELPDGWADIRDPKKVSYGRRKPVKKASVALARHRTEILEQDVVASTEAAAEAHPEILGAVPLEEGAATPEMAEGFIPTEEGMEMFTNLQEAATLALVAGWSWEHPVTIEGLDELPGDAADLLVEHCTELIGDLFTVAEPTPDEASPTSP